MRIGILSQWYEPEPGPAGLPAALARGLVARGHEVEVVTGLPNYPHGVLAPGYRMRPRQVESSDGVRVTRVALYPSHDSSISKRIANYGSFALSSALLGVPAFSKLDALWVNYSPVTIAAPLFVNTAVRKTPSVVHVLDLWPDTLSATGFGAGGGALSRTALRGVDALCGYMYRTASKVAYISPGVGEVLARRGVRPDKLAYAPMWADESPAEAPNPARENYRVPGRFLVVYAGTLGRAQGLDSLIEACALLHDLPITCLIAGTGTEERRLKMLATDRQARNVRFLGQLPKSEMPALSKAADIHYVALNDHPLARVTMPSKMQAILAAGGPILGSLVGDAAMVVQDSGAGWVAPPGDVASLVRALRTAVAEGPDGLTARGLASKAYYKKNFAYERGVDTVAGLLAEAAAGRRS